VTLPGLSLARALEFLLAPDDPARAHAADAERRASAALEAATGRPARGLSLPLATRTLTTDPGTGGEFLGAPALALAGALRDATVLGRAGATFLTGLTGWPSIPTVAAGAASAWVDEGNAPSAATVTLASGALSPSTLTAAVPFSRRIVVMATPDVDAMLEADLAAELSAELDAAALGVSAKTGAPAGLVQALAGTASETALTGAVPTWAELMDLEAAVRASNAPGALSWVLSPAMAAQLAQVDVGPRLALERGRIGDVPAYVTAAMPDDRVILGAFRDLVVGQFGGLDLRIDVATGAASDGRTARAFVDTGFLVRRIRSFAMGRAP